MANTASNCQYETDTAQEPNNSCADNDYLFYSVDFDGPLSSDVFDDLLFNNEETSPSTSSCDSSIRSNVQDALREIDHLLTCSDIPNNMGSEKSIKRSEKKKTMKKGQRYLPSFKKKVLNYAVTHSFRETATKFHINCNTLTEWTREYKRLQLLKNSTTTRPGFSLKTDESGNMLKTEQTDPKTRDIPPCEMASDVKFLHWLKKKRLEGCRLGRNEVQTTGLTILKSGYTTSDWFSLWVNRLIEETTNDKRSKPETQKSERHILYPDSFKIEVALYGEMYTKREAAQTFGVSTRRIYEWCDRLRTPKSDSARNHVEEELLIWYRQRIDEGCRPKCLEIMSKARMLYADFGLPHVKCSQGWLDKIRKRLDLKLSHTGDEKLLLWVLAQLDNNVSLSLLQVTTKARELAVSSGDNAFKGSKGWTLRFLKRHSHLLQCSSARLTDLPPSAAAQAKSFCLALQQRMGAASLEECSVGCMDEIPITFVYPAEASPTPLLRKANLEKAQAVILLAATSDGRLLPPAVVLRGPRAVQTYSASKTSVLVLRHDSGSVDSESLSEWARHVWFPNVKAPSVLVVDSYTPHIDGKLEEELSSGYCHLAIIPPGCAVHLQPCAFNLTQRFQEAVQEEWIKYTSAVTFPSWRKNAGPDDDSILNWVVKAYLSLCEDNYSIRCSFHLTGLTKPAEQVQSSHLVTASLCGTKTEVQV